MYLNNYSLLKYNKITILIYFQPLELCTFVDGDADPGNHKYLDHTSSDELCASLVATTTPNANGATRMKTDGSCFAQFGVTGVIDDTDYRTCIFRG